MKKKQKILLLIFLSAVLSFEFGMVINYFNVHKVTNDEYSSIKSKDLTAQKIIESILSISNPDPIEITEGQEAKYIISFDESYNYTNDSITITGPAQIKDIVKDGNNYVVKVIGKSGNGNVTLNIAAGAFYNDKEKTSQINKTGLLVNNVKTLQLLVEEYLGDDINKIGIMYYDLKTKVSFEINADTPYFPASISKLYTMITLYDLAFENAININEEIYYTRSDYESGSGILIGMDKSIPYDLKTLAKYAIIYSDNIAFHMLNRFISLNKIKEHYALVVGHTITTSGNGNMNMTAKDASLIMQRVYYNQDNNIYYSDFLNSMQNTTATTSKIVKYLSSYTVARKGGDYGIYHHDAAIVYDEDPYVLTFFSKGLNDANEKISQVAKLIQENR